MARITYQYEPLVSRPKQRMRQQSRFRADYQDTLQKLDYEISYLGARDAVLQVDAERSDFRLDGLLRSNAKISSPAVAISFKSKHGPLTYPCDTYNDWKDNLRAIALALTALRAVDRYGVTSRGEQYTGWVALPPPSSNGFANVEEALVFLASIVSVIDTNNLESAIRDAELITHPDRGGRAEDFKRVQSAREMLLKT